MPVLCDNCFPARETLVSPLIAGVVKESYMHLPNRELIYLSLSEARLACFKHHLDEKPMFQIAVSTVMNLSGKSGIRYITTRSSLLKTWNFFYRCFFRSFTVHRRHRLLLGRRPKPHT